VVSTTHTTIKNYVHRYNVGKTVITQVVFKMVKVVYVYVVIIIRAQTSIPPSSKWIRSIYGVYYMVCGVGL